MACLFLTSIELVNTMKESIFPQVEDQPLGLHCRATLVIMDYFRDGVPLYLRGFWLSTARLSIHANVEYRIATA